MSRHPFHELGLATYCPRKLYYHRRDDHEIPGGTNERRELAFEYESLLSASDADLSRRPIALPPEGYRSNLRRSKERYSDAWPEITDPTRRNPLVSGRECRGIVHKVLDLETPVPSMVSTGDPPPEGAWKRLGVRVVAAAKALSWEHRIPVERAFVEFPAHGIVRELPLTTRRKARYRRAIRTLESLDGPPPRLKNSPKCESCEYRGECGVKTRSLRSLLFG